MFKYTMIDDPITMIDESGIMCAMPPAGGNG